MQRQREIAVDDEEELLRMQERFTARGAAADAKPAARAIRIARKPPAATASDAAAPAPAAVCAVHGAGCRGNHGPDQQEQQQVTDLVAAMQAAMRDVVGEVHERQPAAAAPPSAPAPPVPEAPAFPQAAHRKVSKFALGRQRQREAGSGGGAVPVVAPPLAGSLSEGAQIDAENRHLLAAMTPSQVEEAREEALQRLPPAAVEFLRRRGAERAKNAAAAAQAPSPPAAPGSCATGQQAQPAASTAGNKPQAQRQRGRQDGGRQHEQRRGGSGQPQPSATRASAAGRLRFDTEGRVVGLCPADAGTDVAPANVVERDPIRLGGGAGGEGYSVREACLLARSRLAQQRVLALRLLAAVLARSRPSADASTQCFVPLPANLAAELSGTAEAACVQWGAVWHHALHAADVTVLLRRSLDDPHPAVAAAAAEALAALVGAAGPAGAAEEEAAEAADSAPLTGWPAPPLRHMQRPSEACGWVVPPACPGQAGVEGEEGEEVDEQQLAKVDPLTGLLHMGLADRAAYLLGRGRVAAALDPLLSTLIKCCQAGKDAADALLDAPGMVDALKEVLDAPPPPPAAPGGAPPGDAGAAAACYGARPKALRLLRQLACSSKAAARLLQESGAVRFALEHLLRSLGGGGAAAAADARQLGALTESLRLWRCFAQHGFFLLLLDDAYPTLCPHLAPPLPAHAAAAALAGQPMTLLPGELRGWCVAREAFSTAAQLCWHAARSDPAEAQVSPQCAAAVASSALSWLEGLPLRQLVQAGQRGGAPSPRAEGGDGLRRGLSPCPALLAAGGGAHAAMLLGTLAAALHLVGSYWGVQRWHTRAEKEGAAQRLASLGLLAAGEGGEVPPVLCAASELLRRVLGACSASPAEGPMGQPLGAALPSAAAELAVALARLAYAFLPAAQAAAAASAMLAPLLSRQAAATFLTTAASKDATLQQPWDAARQLAVLPLARAAAVGLQAAASASAGASDGAPWDLAAAGTALALLRLLPAGDEATAVRVMAALLGPAQLAGPLASAGASLQAAAASGAAEFVLEGPAVGGGEAGAPPALPPADGLSRLLLAGYAAAWLALVPQEGPTEGGGGDDAAAAAAAVDAPASAAVLRPEGSCLPLPACWVLGEVPLPPAEAGVAAGPAHAAACALLLALGWEAQQLGGLAAPGGSGDAESRLRLAVLLLFGERERAPAGAGMVPRGRGGAQREEEEAAWQQPLARWCLADLLHRYCSQPGGAQAGAAAAAWSEQEARQLAQHFAAVSYGDRLFGAAVAALLRRSVAASVQLEVLSSLADEQALHLLPPLRCLPGPAGAYLAPPPQASEASGSGGYAQPCFGGVPGASAGASARAELGLYLRLLAEGPLQRCLEASSGADSSCLRDCSAALPVVLHRLACACFPEDGVSPGGAKQAQQQATLCSILLRCGAAQQPPAHAAPLLGLLLRWDTAAGGPSDAVPLGRVQAIEQACAAAGVDASRVLGAVLEA